MSLTYNFNNTLYKARKNIMHPASSNIAMFYLSNSSAKEDEIKDFAEKNELNFEEVNRYFSERINEDSIYSNLLNMKYGLKHSMPGNDQVEEYLNKIPKGTNNLTKMVKDDYIDILPEAIPKKVKIPEFQVISGAKRLDRTENNGKEKSPTARTNESHGLSSPLAENTFFYSSISNESPGTTKQSNSQLVEEPKQVAAIISSIKKENSIESRLELSIALINISNPNCLTRFLQLNGTTHLGYWIDDYREDIESHENIDTKVYEILSNILNFCDKLPISVSDLKFSKIGKKINKLGKCIENVKKIKLKCEELVARWKKMIENIKDKKKSHDDKNEKDSKYSNELSDDEITQEVIKSPHKQISNNPYHNSENTSMLKKTQRQEIESPNDKNYKKIRTQENETSENIQMTSYKNPMPNNYINNQIRNVNMYENNFNSNVIPNYNSSNNFRSNVNQVNQVNSSNNQIQNKYLSSQQVFISQVTKPQPVKGILKKLDKTKREKKTKVRWELEEKLEKVKLFKLTDEVEAPAITEEEYKKIQTEILKNPNYKLMNDMRSKEINMEKENLSKVREKNKITKDILIKMIPSVQWTRPHELLNQSNHHNDFKDENHNSHYETLNTRGSESEEKNIINLLCQKILSVTYFRDAEIPDCPQLGPSKLFSFTDENIQKIENVKNVYNPEKPNANAEIFEYIDNLHESKLTPEILNTISQKIENNHFTPEEKAKILDYLKRHLNKDSVQPSNRSIAYNQRPQFVKNFVHQINPSSSHNPLNMNNAFNFNNAVNMPSMPIINPLNNKLNTPVAAMHSMNFQDKKMMGKQQDNREQKLPLNMNMNKIFTRPCRNYHGPNGCNRGDNCHFIHDQNFQGRDIPNFNLNNYRSYGQNGNDKRYQITNVNIVNNYGNPADEKEELNNLKKESSIDSRANDSNLVTPTLTNSANTSLNISNKEPTNFAHGMNMNMNSNYMPQKHFQHNNFNQGNKMMMPGYPMNAIRPPFMNNMNMKNSMNNTMGLNGMNNLNMNMGMNMSMNSHPNMPNVSNMTNNQNLNNNQPNPAFMGMQPNPYMYMNNYARMPFNMMPPQNQANNNHQTSYLPKDSTGNK